jgi:hypothetical protein
MRIFFITLLLLIMCPFTGISFADEKSDCLSNCANDKRAQSMYCPPAGGFTDQDNKQCVDKYTTEYNNCIKACSPPVTPPEDQQSTTPPPPTEPVGEPVATDKQDESGDLLK